MRGHWLTGRAGQVPLAKLVAALCAEVGVMEIDTGSLGGLVEGYVIDRPMSPREALAPLFLAHHFDAVESDGLIRFVPRGAAPGIVLEPDDLVAEENGNAGPYRLVRGQESELPRRARVSYVNGEGDYQPAIAEAGRLSGASERVSEAELPLVMDGGRASGVAETLLAEAWMGRERASFRLPPSYLAIDPGDVVDLVIGGEGRAYRVSQITDEGVLEVSAVASLASHYAYRVGTGRSESLADPAVFGPPLVVFADLPLLTGAEVPHAPHIGAFASPWPGAVAVYRSPDGTGFDLDTLLDTPATLGLTETDFYAGPTGRLDHGNALWVRLVNGQLGSVSDADLFAGANTAALQNADGDWEVFQFAVAELVGPDTYRLSRFLRGQAGTETAMRNPVAAGARFLLVDGALTQLSLRADERDLALTLRMGPAPRGIDHPSYGTSVESFTGIGLRPLSPVHGRYHIPDGSSDLLLSWVRRTRIGGDSWASVEVPLGESRESYRVEILNGPTIMRSAVTGTPAWLYTAADQIADFGVAPALPLTVRFYQTNDEFGDSPAMEMTFHE